MTDRSVIFQAYGKSSETIGQSGLGSPGQNRPGSNRRQRRRGTIAATRQDARTAKAAARRDAILEAALDEFSAKGFASARLEDVAKRAGIAKGTIYLYFADKESLFQELIRAKMVPVVGSLELALATDLPLRAIIEQAIEIFVREVYGTRRKRGDPADDQRGPALSGRRPSSTIARCCRACSRRCAACCATPTSAASSPSDALVRFPMLLGAPGIVAIVWSGLFDRFEPLDVRAMMRAYFDNLFGAGRAA